MEGGRNDEYGYGNNDDDLQESQEESQDVHDKKSSPSRSSKRRGSGVKDALQVTINEPPRSMRLREVGRSSYTEIGSDDDDVEYYDQQPAEEEGRYSIRDRNAKNAEQKSSREERSLSRGKKNELMGLETNNCTDKRSRNARDDDSHSSNHGKKRRLDNNNKGGQEEEEEEEEDTGRRYSSRTRVVRTTQPTLIAKKMGHDDEEEEEDR